MGNCKRFGSTQRVRHLELINYEMAVKHFGVQQSMKSRFVSRRQKEILRLRKELDSLKRAWHATECEEEKSGIELFQDDVRDQLRKLRKLKCARKRRWRREKIKT